MAASSCSVLLNMSEQVKPLKCIRMHCQLASTENLTRNIGTSPSAYRAIERDWLSFQQHAPRAGGIHVANWSIQHRIFWLVDLVEKVYSSVANMTFMPHSRLFTFRQNCLMTVWVKITPAFIESASKNIIENDSSNYNILHGIIKSIKRSSFKFHKSELLF